MTARERWQHATAAYSLIYRSLEANGTEAAWALCRAARRLRQAGEPDLAEQAEELADDWYPADSEIRSTLNRVAALTARLEKEALA